jgi:hypothetical protein
MSLDLFLVFAFGDFLTNTAFAVALMGKDDMDKAERFEDWLNNLSL